MNSGSGLFLHEEILLLALRDNKGTVDVGSMHAYSIAGAMLAELTVRRRIELVGPEKKRMVQVVDRSLVGEPLLDEALERIAGAKRRGSVPTWVSRLAGTRKMTHRLAQGLCRRGILRAEEKDVLIVFKRKTYPELDPKAEREIVQRLREAIFEGREPDARTVVLLSLAHGTGLLKMVFEKKALKAQKKRIEGLIEGEVLGKAVKAVVEAAQVAIAVATVGS